MDPFSEVFAELKLSFSSPSTEFLAENPSEWVPFTEKFKSHLSAEKPVLIVVDTVPYEPKFDEIEELIPFFELPFVIIEITPPAPEEP